jgi:hypothetical protein
MSAAITGMIASVVEEVVAGVADGAGIGDELSDGVVEPSVDALGATEGDELAEGAGVAATTVNVVTPRSSSPSSVDTVVHRIWYAPEGRGAVRGKVIFRASPLATWPPFATTVPVESTTANELFVGSRFCTNVPTISVGDGTVDLSAGLIVSSSAWPTTAGASTTSRRDAAAAARSRA